MFEMRVMYSIKLELVLKPDLISETTSSYHQPTGESFEKKCSPHFSLWTMFYDTIKIYRPESYSVINQ